MTDEEKCIQDLIELEKRKSYGQGYKLLKFGLKEYYGIDWDEEKAKYMN